MSKHHRAAGWGGHRVTELRVSIAHRMRAAWLMQAQVICPICHEPILPGQSWDVGHTFPVSTHPHLMWSATHLHAEHSACNRAGGARMTNAIVARKRANLWDW